MGADGEEMEKDDAEGKFVILLICFRILGANSP